MRMLNLTRLVGHFFYYITIIVFIIAMSCGCGRRRGARDTFVGIPNHDFLEGTVVLEDNFFGKEEYRNWDNSKTTGIGDLIYFDAAPGFVRLQLDGPGRGGIYHNAEKKYFGPKKRKILYCDLEIRLRNNNNNGWDAPEQPDSHYGLGSRGWGLWNNQMNLAGGNVIWFASISPESGRSFRGTKIWIIADGVPVIFKDINLDLTNWHIYRIRWRRDYIGIFIDDMDRAVAKVTDSRHIPKVPLSFTVWVDNYAFSGRLAKPIIRYLEVPAIKQYIDVDYVKISIP